MKIYGEGDSEVRALDGVTVAFEAGQFTAIMGPSGSGKSTLMHCLAGLDSLTSGAVYIGDTVPRRAERQGAHAACGATAVGFIFQAYNLVPTLTALREHHAAAAARLARMPDQAWIDNVIDTVGLRDRLKHRPQRAVAAASSSASPSPGRSRAGRRSSSPTSRPATSTAAPAPRSSSSCAAPSASSARRS